MRGVVSPELDPLLRATSRSFFLTLRVAPAAVRRQLGCAYLFCRAADTIADTRILPAAERLELLSLYRAQFLAERPDAAALQTIGRRVESTSEIAEERALLERLGDCTALYLRFDTADRLLVRRLVATLCEGMRLDLETFPPAGKGEVAALAGDGELDLYTYHVAGCVGEFWTDLAVGKLRALAHWDARRFRELGVRFGKGLQLTNILRDVDRDLAIGRSYLPAPRLAAVGLDAVTLAAAQDRSAARPVVHDLIRLTLDHYRAGWEYTLAVPRRLSKLRLACIWPLWIGLATLAQVAAAKDPCAPGVVRKISRSELSRLLRAATLRVLSNRALDRRYRALEAQVSRQLAAIVPPRLRP